MSLYYNKSMLKINIQESVRYILNGNHFMKKTQSVLGLDIKLTILFLYVG